MPGLSLPVGRRRSRRFTSLPHCVFLPRRRLNLDRDSIGACGQQELSAAGVLEQCTLLVAEVKSALELGRLPGSLSSEEENRRVGGHNRPSIRAQEVTGILRREDKGAAVLADAPG